MEERFSELMESLNDPVAERTHWTADINRTNSFRTHKLVQQSPHRIAFKVSRQTVLPLCAFIAVGTAFCGLGACLLGAPETSQGRLVLPLVLLAIGMGFAGFGIVALFLSSRHKEFDLDASVLWSGNKPFNLNTLKQRRDSMAPGRIHAIQLLWKQIYGKVSKKPGAPSRWGFSHNNYELNLVLQDGSRMAVVDYGDLEAIRADAARLGECLGVPVWDATKIDAPTIDTSRGFFGRYKRFWRRAQGGSRIEVGNLRDAPPVPEVDNEVQDG